MNQAKNEICSLLSVHAAVIIKGQRSSSQESCYPGGYSQVCRCITAVTFASEDHRGPSRLDSFSAGSMAGPPNHMQQPPQFTAVVKNTIRQQSAPIGQLLVSPAQLHGVLQTVLAGVGWMEL